MTGKLMMQLLNNITIVLKKMMHCGRIIIFMLLFILCVIVYMLYMQKCDITKSAERSESGSPSENSIANKDGWYYYGFMDLNQRKIYNSIYQGIILHECCIDIMPVDEQNLKKIYYAIRFDNPELIYIGDKYNYKKDEGGKVSVFYPVYTMDISDSSEKIEEIRAEMEAVKESTKAMSAYKKELYIHDYILKKCSYYDDGYADATLYGALVTGNTNCRGYSAAFSYLLNNCGIKSGQMIGSIVDDKSNEGHSWNFIVLDDEYYYCDICWDDISFDDSSGAVPYHYSFFNTTYEEMSITHNTEIQKEYLYDVNGTNSGKYSYMKQNGLYASSYKDACDIIKNKIAASKAFNKPLMIQCENYRDYSLVCNSIDKIMKIAINKTGIDVSYYKYIKVQNGNTIIIYNLE